MELNRSCSALREGECQAIERALATAWHSPAHRAQAPHPPWPPLPGTALAPIRLCTAAAHGTRRTASRIPLLAALPWLPCAARTIAACRRTAPDHKLQRCPSALTPSGAAEPLRTHAHAHTCGRVVRRATRQRCPRLSLAVPLRWGTRRRRACRFCGVLLFASSEEAQDEVMLGESSLR